MTGWLRRGAESVLVLMMAAMFVAFILQVLFRYALNLPVGWTDEVCTLVWMWGILWGASFVLKNRDDIRFDMLYSRLPRLLGHRHARTVFRRRGFLPRALQPPQFPQHFIQTKAVDVLHGVVMQATLLAHAEHRHDVRMVQPGCRPRLAIESRLPRLVPDQLLGQHLQRHFPP